MGDTRPLFARGYPRDAALDALVGAFVRGDFGRVRRDAPPVILDGSSPEVRAAAEDVLARTRPDPLSRVFFALTAALLLFLSVYWWWKAGRG
jgi:hypothetical protein